MSVISTWDVVAANNDSAPPDGFPENMLPSALNNCSREVMSALAKYYGDVNGTLTSTGTGAAYVLATNQAEAALAAGQEYSFKTHLANTSTTPTLAVDGLTAKTITKNGAAALVAGDMVLNSLVTVKYDGTQFQLVSHIVTPVTKAIIDALAVDAGALDGLDSLAFIKADGSVDLTGNVSGITPTADAHLTRKDYVDGLAGSPTSSQTFTSSGTWTKPAGVTSVIVELVSGGGGGAGAAASEGGSSGGGGGYAKLVIDVSAISSETVTIGAAGSAGAAAGAGGAGGSTSFGAHCSATGGAGGVYTTGSDVGGAGGAGTGGDITISGGRGGGSSHSGYLSSGGGDSQLGTGGGANHITTGSDGAGYGGGGGGGVGTASVGGAGTAGFIVVWEY